MATAALERKGELAPGWTPETASDWIYHQAHIDTWQHLVIERGWPPKKAVEQTIDSLLKTLCVDSPASKSDKKKA